VVGLTYLPYALSGEGGVWWDSVILAPLGYTKGRGSSLFSLILINGAILGFLAWGFWTKRLSHNRRGIVIMGLSVLGIVLSFLKAGRVNSHYLILVYPPLLVLVAAFCNPYKIRKGMAKALIILALLLPAESYLEYYRILRYRMERGTWYNGEGFSVPAYLREEGIPTDSILFLGYHIGYWVLDQYPPVKTATHPSNLCKAEMFPYYNPERQTALEELRYLMEVKRPNPVITRHKRRIFDKSHELENTYMDSVLIRDYRLIRTVDNADIYLRKE
jgi:hypothetical protein